MNNRYDVQFSEHCWQAVRVTTINERVDAGRRRRRVLARVTRAVWRLDQPERERGWSLVSARAEGVSIRAPAKAAGLSPSRVHQIVATADPDELDSSRPPARPHPDLMFALRLIGTPRPVDPDPSL